jgi:hypothetical protein
MWIASNISAGLTSVTINTQAYKEYSCEVAEVSGIVTSSPVDVTYVLADNSYGTGNATTFTGSVTTVNSRDVILGYVVGTGSLGAFTAGTGYTAIGTATTGNFPAFLEYKKVSATGTYNPGATYANSAAVATGTAALILQ